MLDKKQTHELDKKLVTSPTSQAVLLFACESCSFAVRSTDLETEFFGFWTVCCRLFAGRALEPSARRIVNGLLRLLTVFWRLLMAFATKGRTAREREREQQTV